MGAGQSQEDLDYEKTQLEIAELKREKELDAMQLKDFKLDAVQKTLDIDQDLTQIRDKGPVVPLTDADLKENENIAANALMSVTKATEVISPTPPEISPLPVVQEPPKASPEPDANPVQDPPDVDPVETPRTAASTYYSGGGGDSRTMYVPMADHRLVEDDNTNLKYAGIALGVGAVLFVATSNNKRQRF